MRNCHNYVQIQIPNTKSPTHITLPVHKPSWRLHDTNQTLKKPVKLDNITLCDFKVQHFPNDAFNAEQIYFQHENRFTGNGHSFSFAESPFVIKWVSSDYTLVPPWSSPQMHWQIPRHSLVQFSHRGGTKMSLLITHHRLHITRSRRQIPALFARRNTLCLEFSF